MQVLNVTKLYMAGFAGSLGAARFASENTDLLKSRFREDYIREQLKTLLEDAEITETTDAEPITVIDEIYRIAHDEKRGLEVRLRDIPIRQFTIEVCELAGLDPYHLETRARIWLGDNADNKNAACIGCTYDGLDVLFVR